MRLERQIVLCVIGCVLALPAGAALAATITVTTDRR